MSAPDEMSASGGWIAVVSGILVAMRRRPSANRSSRSPSDPPLIELVRSVFRRGKGHRGRVRRR
jgi:hypothetical protein